MKLKIIFLLFISFLNFSCSNTKSFHNQKIKKLTEIESLKKYGENISLAEALKIGKERNLTLKIKTLEREISTLDKNISFGNFLPSINLVGNYSQLDNDINIDFDISELTSSLGNAFSAIGESAIASNLNSQTTMSSTLIEKSSYTYGINAQIPIFVPSYWYLYSAKKNGEDMSKLVESLAKKLIELQITSQYFYILTLESQEIYLKNEVKSIEETTKRAKISLEVESIMPWEYKKALVLLKTKKYNLKENKRNLKIAKMNLLKSLDLNPLDNITLESYNFKQEPFPDLEECILNSLTNNETLKISNLNVDVSQNAKKIAISNFLPKIILGGGYVNNSNKILSDPSFLNVNVSGVISLFNGFKNINEYKKAIRKEKIANLNLEKEFMKTIIETANAYYNLKKIDELLEISKLNLNAEKEKLKQSKAELSVGIISEDKYFNSLASYNQSLTAVKNLEFNYNLSLSSLNITMGKSPIDKGE